MHSRLDKWHGMRLFSQDADNNKASRVEAVLLTGGKGRLKKRETRMQYLQVTGHVVNGLILADGWANEWLLCQREVSVMR